MPKYLYSRLSHGSIRLLQLQPRKEDPKNIRCKLFEYPLRNLDSPSHLYEALSYVWVTEHKSHSIVVGDADRTLGVTQNLYALLLRLQNHSFSRIIWVDAICINQEDEREKEHQIPFMAEIYANANLVIVWLGEAEEHGDQALESIRVKGEESAVQGRQQVSLPERLFHDQHIPTTSSKQFQPAPPTDTTSRTGKRQAAGIDELEDKKLGRKRARQVEPLQLVRHLLERSWFQRMWVLQEVAAARRIVIKCGSVEVDGHAFCVGLESLSTTLDVSTTQVAFLIRGAIFRSRRIPRKQARPLQDIYSLGELVDMYQTHKATRLHDKIYALLGMCSDDFQVAGLEPNYNLEWKVLMHRLVKFILGDQVSIQTWDDEEIAVINSECRPIGKVVKAENNVDSRGNMQSIGLVFGQIARERVKETEIIHWTLRTSAKSIQDGDIICFLPGASKPVVARLRNGYFTIIMIAAALPGHKILPTHSHSTSCTRSVLLVWDWGIFSETFQHSYDIWIQTKSLTSEYSGCLLNSMVRRWNASLIMGDLGEWEKAEEELHGAIEMFVEEEHLHMKMVIELLFETGKIEGKSKDNDCRRLLSYAAANGHKAVIKLLLGTIKVDAGSGSVEGRTPLWYAAGNGHEGIVKQLLEAKADVESKGNYYSQTPLSHAAVNGHEAVVKLLLEANACVDSKYNSYSQTPLSFAAKSGHGAVVKLLLESNADVDSKNSSYGQTPLSLAAWSGHEAIVKLLLDGNANIESRDRQYNQTPLWWAAVNGHEDVVKLLLEANADVNSKDNPYGRTPLSFAAENGYEAVVRLLLMAKADCNSEPMHGRTPLWHAARNGHEAVVRLLLAMDRFNVDLKGIDRNQTPLSCAAENGHEAVVRLLLDTGKMDVDSKDSFGGTPLLHAAQNGHEAVVRLLLRAKSDVDSKDCFSRTPLWEAAENGHEAVVKLLLRAKADVDLRNRDSRTPLRNAAANGHEAVVRLLLRAKADINSKDCFGGTPLSSAAANGHHAVVKLLLRAKADVDSKDSRYGRTPLSFAAVNGHEVVVRLLLETGKVDIHSKDTKYNRTPLSWAAESGHEAIVKLLQSFAQLLST